MHVISVILNIPWSLIGVITALLSFPDKITFVRTPPAIVFWYRRFWWYQRLPGKSQARALANGHVIQMSRHADGKDLAHELIHVEQHMRWPFFFPFMYLMEMLRNGTRIENRFEKEAYTRSKSRYGNFVS